MKKMLNHKQPHDRGFTLIELLITVAVLAIVVSWGFPSLEQSIRNNRMAAQNNEMLAILNFAKSEAIRRNTSVEVHLNVSPSEGGWAAYIKDPSFAADVEGCQPGQLRCAHNNKVTMAMENESTSIITFNNRGYIRDADDPWSEEVIFLQHDNCSGPRQKRRIQIMPTGQINSCQLACGSTECS